MTAESSANPEAVESAAYLRGVLFALCTCLLWGVLPIVSKAALTEFSAGTIVWFRFVFAFTVLLAVLGLRKSEPLAILRHPPGPGLLAGVCLAANYFYFLRGVQFSGPSNTAILIQLAPVLVVLAGVYLFHEKLRGRQAAGMFVAVGGFVIFYLDQKQQTVAPGLYSIANGHIIFAAVVWAVYATALKYLSVRYEAQSLNLLVYGVAGMMLVFGVAWAEFAAANSKSWLLLVFLGLNTLLAYGALLEAIRLIPLTHVSVIITLNPLITLLVMHLIGEFKPGWIEPEVVGSLGYLGAFTAVAGVALVVVRR
ncbi:MAG: DMT family transporter [Nitrospinales bacterium]